MRTVRRITLCLLFVCLVVAVSWPAGQIGAQDAFAFASLMYTEQDGQLVAIQNNQQVYRGLTSMTVNFNHALNAATIQDISLKDSTGTTVPLKNLAITGTGNTAIAVTLNQTLQKNEPYTFTITGGANGVLDTQNNSLPADVAITFQTDDTAVINTITLNGYQKSSGPDAYIYRISAAQGPFTLQVNQIGLGNVISMMIQNPNTGATLTKATLVQTQAGAAQSTKYDMPNTGEYDLVLIPKYAPGQTIHAQSMAISANELQIPDPYIPPVTLRAMQMYETVSSPFPVQAGVQNNGKTKFLKLFLNGQVLADNLLQNGTVQDYKINPSNLQDNIYMLELQGESPDSSNQGLSVRTFFVDHVNTYADVPVDQWAHKPIEILSHMQVLHGTSPGRFLPSKPVTRAEFAAMIVGILHLSTTATPNVTFADDPHDWSSKYIYALAAAGLTTGVHLNGQTYFYPQATISRQEAATIIGRALGISQADISNFPAPFPDFTDVQPYAQPSVLLLSKENWINGYGQPLMFHPSALLYRDQAAKIISKFTGM